MVQIYKTQNAYDNRAIHMEVEPLDVINRPVIREEKEQCPMWGFYEGASTITPNKRAENFEMMTALLLDYDSGVSIEQVQRELRPFLHFGYTSFNHRPEKPRFRVVLPLAQPMPLLTPKQQEVVADAFPGIDRSSFARGRFFYMPAICRERASAYRRWRSVAQQPVDTTAFWSGVLAAVTAANEVEPYRPVITLPSVLRSGNHERGRAIRLRPVLAAVEEILGALDFNRRGAGQGIHSTLLRCNGRMTHAGMTVEERLAVLERFARDADTEKEIECIVKGFHQEVLAR